MTNGILLEFIIIIGVFLLFIRLAIVHIIRIKVYDIETDKVASDKRLVLLSDYHMGNLKYCDYVLLKKIENVSPDYIFIAGDLLTTYPAAYHGVRDDYKWADKIAGMISELCRKSKVYIVDGNHEIKLKAAFSGAYMPVVERYEDLIKKSGAVFLHNTSVHIDHDLVVTGLELDDNNYDKIGKVFPSELDIYEKIGDRFGTYNILLTHTPEFFSLYDKWGADLILCGHMHGGIARLGQFGFVGPDRKLFPKYVYGKYAGEKSTMIVSAGIGEHTIPIRIFNPREVVVLNLKRRGKA